MFCQTASISDREHVFCQCELTCEAWKWLKLNLAVMAGGRLESDINILSLFIPNNDCQREIIWLLGKYVSYVWNSVHLQGSHVTVGKFFGFLRWKYKEEKSYLAISKLENLLLWDKDLCWQNNSLDPRFCLVEVTVTLRKIETCGSQRYFSKILTFDLDARCQCQASKTVKVIIDSGRL